MLRLAISEFGRRRLVGTGAGVLTTCSIATGYNYFKNETEPIKSTSSSFPTADLSHVETENILQSLFQKYQEYNNENNDAINKNDGISSLVIPTLEASLRGCRLLQTVMLMVMDYQLPDYSEHFFTFPKHGSDQCNDIEQQKEADLLVRNRTKQLEVLQVQYTTGPTDDEIKINIDPRTSQVSKAFRTEWHAKKREEVLLAAQKLSEAEEHQAQSGDRKRKIHEIAANRLSDLCRKNGGVYIKVGQHLANLDYLIPSEYIDSLSSLFDATPETPYEKVRQIIKDDFGQYPEDLFESFEEKPIASASLAQVHVAVHKETGEKLAVKVQHHGLRETSRGDMLALDYVVRIVDKVFEEFSWGWILEEIAPNLPKELDFCHEGKNSEIAAQHIQKAKLDCVIPKVFWNLTTSRVLCMKFEDGFRSTDIESIEAAGLKKRDVARLISSVFNSQVFQSGHIHCDPHPANVLLRANKKNGKPEMVLVDHGLYKQIDDEFRITYSKLWKGLMLADIDQIKQSCEDLGVNKMYPLLAAMLTSRPFDEVIERSKSGKFSANKPSSSNEDGDGADKALIRGYAQQYLKEIIQMLDIVPRQMLLIFKMNDCLRHIDCALGSPSTSNLVVAGSYASQTVFNYERTLSGTNSLGRIRNWLSYIRVFMRIQLYDIWSYWQHRYNFL